MTATKRRIDRVNVRVYEETREALDRIVEVKSQDNEDINLSHVVNEALQEYLKGAFKPSLDVMKNKELDNRKKIVLRVREDFTYDLEDIEKFTEDMQELKDKHKRYKNNIVEVVEVLLNELKNNLVRKEQAEQLQKQIKALEKELETKITLHDGWYVTED